MRVGLYSVVVVALAALAVGCRGHEYGDYCDKQKSCEGGNDKDKDACVDQLEGEEDIADDYDCGDQFDKVTKCLKDNSVCTDGVYSEGTRCDTEETAYITCVDAASATIQLQP
jgi:hypothetical protein